MSKSSVRTALVLCIAGLLCVLLDGEEPAASQPPRIKAPALEPDARAPVPPKQSKGGRRRSRRWPATARAFDVTMPRMAACILTSARISA